MQRRAAVIAIAVAIIGLSIGGLVGLAVHDNGGTKVASRESATSTSTSTSTTQESTTSSTASTPFTALGSTTTTATKATTTTVPTSAAVHAPQPGTYTYAETITPANGAPKQSTYTVKIIVDPDEGGRNRRTVVNGDGSGTDEQAWGSDAVFSLRASGSLGCTWQPPRVLYDGTLRVNETWSYTSRCYNQPSDRLLEEQGSFKVTAINPDHTWIIHVTRKTTVTYSKTGQVADEINLDGDMRFDPQRGLIVQQHDTFTTKSSPTPTAQDIHLT